MTLLKDLARAKITFQARTLATILTEGMDMTVQSKHDQMLELVGRFRQTIAQVDNPNIIAAHVDDVSAMCDALTVLLEENAVLRTEKHADAEAIGALREALSGAVSTITDYIEYEHDGDPWTEDARAMREMDIDDYATDGRLEAAREALKGSNQ